jgi:putative flavoprotein involved in K+ transport
VANHEVWQAKSIIVATGWSDQPAIPAVSSRLENSILQLAPADYRNPGQLPDGAVLVVGASASGVQLADELRRDGRTVYLSVGRHTRMRRRYRGRDMFWWLDQIGALDRGIDTVHSPGEARFEPSMQLIGRNNGINVDLPTLASAGVMLLGRLTAIDAGSAYFSDDLLTTMRSADQRLCKTLERIDQYIAGAQLAELALPRERPATRYPLEPPRRIDLRAAGVSSVIWATGHRRDYHWLDVPIIGSDGELTHRYGVTAVPGLYALGQRFQRTRRSNFLDGVGTDALFITQHLLREEGVGRATALTRP